MRTLFLLLVLVCVVACDETGSLSDEAKTKLRQQQLQSGAGDELRQQQLGVAKGHAILQSELEEDLSHVEPSQRASRQEDLMGSKNSARHGLDPKPPKRPCNNYQDCLQKIHHLKMDIELCKLKLTAPPRRCATCENGGHLRTRP